MYQGAPDRWCRFVPDARHRMTTDRIVNGDGSLRDDRVRILLADDDPQVLAITTRILRRQSWEVVTAVDGQEVLDRWPIDGEPFDLTILDVNMPGMNGYEAFRELQRLHPGARTLFISGYADVPSWRKLVEEGGQPFLAKPFSPGRLVEVVRSLIQQDHDDAG